MGCHDSVLGTGGHHTHYFLRAQVCREECQAGDPDRDVVASGQKLPGGGYGFAEFPPDAEDKTEIEREDGVVDRRKLQACEVIRNRGTDPRTLFGGRWFRGEATPARRGFTNNADYRVFK